MRRNKQLRDWENSKKKSVTSQRELTNIDTFFDEMKSNN